MLKLNDQNQLVSLMKSFMGDCRETNPTIRFTLRQLLFIIINGSHLRACNINCGDITRSLIKFNTVGDRLIAVQFVSDCLMSALDSV